MSFVYNTHTLKVIKGQERASGPLKMGLQVVLKPYTHCRPSAIGL